MGVTPHIAENRSGDSFRSIIKIDQKKMFLLKQVGQDPLALPHGGDAARRRDLGDSTHQGQSLPSLQRGPPAPGQRDARQRRREQSGQQEPTNEWKASATPVTEQGYNIPKSMADKETTLTILL